MDNEMQVANDPGETPTKSYRTRGLTIGLAAGLLGGTAAGLVFGVPGLSSASSPSAVVAQTDDTTPDDSTPAGSTPTDSTPADSESAEVESGTRLREALQPLVDDGTITAAQADAVVEQLKESLPERGGRFGHGGPGHRGGGVFGHVLGEASDVVTGVLGIDTETLVTELRAGKSLADIATENGVEPQAVIDAIVAETTTQIDQAVTDGRIDADRAEQVKADLVDHVTDLVNGNLPDFGDFPGRHGRFDDESDDESDDSTDAPATTDAPTTTDAPATTDVPVTTGD